MSEQQRAIKDVADERRRQQASEGYEPEHDDEYVRGELAYAAACYALSGARHPEKVPGIWPWQQSAFKPKSRREDLVRAGALVLAEIERLDRAAFADQPADDLAPEMKVLEEAGWFDPQGPSQEFGGGERDQRIAELERERDALAAGLDRDTRSRYQLIDRLNALERALCGASWALHYIAGREPLPANVAPEDMAADALDYDPVLRDAAKPLTDQPAQDGEADCCARTRETLKEAESALCIAGDHVLHCAGSDSDDHQQINDTLEMVRAAIRRTDKDA